MTSQPWIPANPGTLLLFAELVFVWMFTNYALPDGNSARRPALTPAAWAWIALRSLAAAVISFCLSRSLVATGVVFVASLLAPWIRRKLSPRFLAEFDLALNAIVLPALLWLAIHSAIPGIHPARLSDDRTAAIFFTAAIFLFTVRGGTYIVRGILNKVGALPPLAPVPPRSDTEFAIDVKEYNRGRLIGDLERILLIIMVAVHSYEALGFLIAAKGLIRSRELENRSWAEYFLVGTLASTLVAVIAGLTLQWLLKALWY